MPRRRKSKQNKMGKDPIECIPFTNINSFDNTATTFAAPLITTLNVDPTLDIARSDGIADFFQFYRYKKLRVTLHPQGDTNAGQNINASVAAGYIPRIPNTAPTTFNQIISLPASRYLANNCTKPQVLNIPTSVLIGDSPLKWYQTKAGTDPEELEVQGVIYLATFSQSPGATVVYQIDGVIEFKGRSNSTQTPLWAMPKPPIPFNQMTVSDSGKSWADQVIEAEKNREKSQNDSDSTVTIGGYVYKRL